MDYTEAQNRVVKRWYESRIIEETKKNQRLKDLHEDLMRLKQLKEQEESTAK